jgi:hypothetical protein
LTAIVAAQWAPGKARPRNRQYLTAHLSLANQYLARRRSAPGAGLVRLCPPHVFKLFIFLQRFKFGLDGKGK